MPPVFPFSSETNIKSIKNTHPMVGLSGLNEISQIHSSWQSTGTWKELDRIPCWRQQPGGGSDDEVQHLNLPPSIKTPLAFHVPHPRKETLHSTHRHARSYSYLYHSVQGLPPCMPRARQLHLHLFSTKQQCEHSARHAAGFHRILWMNCVWNRTANTKWPYDSILSTV